jgi:hypothetical protein
VTVGTIGWIADIGGAISQDIRGPQLYSRGALDVRPTERLTLSLGYDLALERLTASYHGPGITPSEGDPSGMGPVSGQVLTTINTTATFFRPAAYLEAIWRGPGGLTLAGGGRADYFGDIHRASFDPRLAARLAVGEATAIKGGVGLFSQPPDYGQAVPGFGNPNLEPARALHAGLGVERTVGSDGGWLTVGAEAFAKRLSDLVVRSPGSAAGDGMALVSDGVGRVYGLELLARTRQNARASGFLAYTLSRSERRDAPGAAWRLFDYDQTHILTAAGAVRFGRGWSLGGTFRLASGSPETPVIGSIYDADRDLYRAVFGPVNGTRAPLFHRLDLRVEKQWRPGRMLLALYLDVLNAYNQRKREVTAYGFDYRQQGGVSGLPVLPSLGLRGEL